MAERVDEIMQDMMTNNGLIHRLVIESSSTIEGNEDLYLNEFTEWLDHPKCKAILTLAGNVELRS